MQLSIPLCSNPLECPLDEFISLIANRIETACISAPGLAAYIANKRQPPAPANINTDPGNDGWHTSFVVVTVLLALTLTSLTAIIIVSRRRRRNSNTAMSSMGLP